MGQEREGKKKKSLLDIEHQWRQISQGLCPFVQRFNFKQKASTSFI